MLTPITNLSRPDGRLPDQLRTISFVPNIAPNSTGSVLCCFGDTRVICTAMIEEKVPAWMNVIPAVSSFPEGSPE